MRRRAVVCRHSFFTPGPLACRNNPVYWSKETASMTTRFKTSLAAGVAALMLAGAAPVLAQDQPQRPERQRRVGPGVDAPRGMRGAAPEFRFLDLTEDQQAQLRKIREARQPE